MHCRLVRGAFSICCISHVLLYTEADYDIGHSNGLYDAVSKGVAAALARLDSRPDPDRTDHMRSAATFSENSSITKQLTTLSTVHSLFFFLLIIKSISAYTLYDQDVLAERRVGGQTQSSIQTPTKSIRPSDARLQRVLCCHVVLYVFLSIQTDHAKAQSVVHTASNRG